MHRCLVISVLGSCLTALALGDGRPRKDAPKNIKNAHGIKLRLIPAGYRLRDSGAG